MVLLEVTLIFLFRSWACSLIQADRECWMCWGSPALAPGWCPAVAAEVGPLSPLTPVLLPGGLGVPRGCSTLSSATPSWPSCPVQMPAGGPHAVSLDMAVSHSSYCCAKTHLEHMMPDEAVGWRKVLIFLGQEQSTFPSFLLSGSASNGVCREVVPCTSTPVLGAAQPLVVGVAGKMNLRVFGS